MDSLALASLGIGFGMAVMMPILVGIADGSPRECLKAAGIGFITGLLWPVVLLSALGYGIVAVIKNDWNWTDG